MLATKRRGRHANAADAARLIRSYGQSQKRIRTRILRRFRIFFFYNRRCLPRRSPPSDSRARVARTRTAVASRLTRRLVRATGSRVAWKSGRRADFHGPCETTRLSGDTAASRSPISSPPESADNVMPSSSRRKVRTRIGGRRCGGNAAKTVRAGRRLVSLTTINHRVFWLVYTRRSVTTYTETSL